MKQCFVWIFAISIVIFVGINLSYWYNVEYSKGLISTFCKTGNEEYLPNVKLGNQKLTPSTIHSLTGAMTIEPHGRLGNLMGEYGALYALAKLNGHRAYILPDMHRELSKLFKINLPVISKDADKRTKWKKYKINNWMSPEYHNISGENVKLLGVVCSWTFYHDVKDEILQEFTFHDFVKEETNAYLEKVRGGQNNVTYIGVHVRRGDYVQIWGKQKKAVLADKMYLKKATDYFRNKYENPLFLVTSNGMDWCKENINNLLGDVHFAGDGNEASPVRDFAILAHCNHTIMTFGTFGIWAAYLAGGETIHLSNYTLPDSPYVKFVKDDSTYLPEWIGIPADLSSLLKNSKEPKK